MTHTAIFLALSLAPLAAAFVAMIAAFVVAAFVSAACEAPHVADATPAKSAEWLASFDSIDVDAEWIAICDALESVDALDHALATLENDRTVVRAAVLAPSTRAMVASFRAERAACDAAIAATAVRTETHRTAIVGSAKAAITAARTRVASRFVARMRCHTAEATSPVNGAPYLGINLASYFTSDAAPVTLAYAEACEAAALEIAAAFDSYAAAESTPDADACPPTKRSGASFPVRERAIRVA